MSDLFYFGLAHNHAPLAVREFMRPHEEAQADLLARLVPITSERMVLATCERFELYMMTDDLEPASWRHQIASWFRLPEELLNNYSRAVIGDSVARQLLRVAGGLESRIVGETQILGQVRTAYQQALESGALGPILSALGRAALHAGKRVRHETMISAGVRSLGAIASCYVERTVGDLSRLRVTIVGRGKLASELAASFAFRGLNHLTIVGRDFDRAATLANRFSGYAVAWENLAESICASDVTVTCTSAASYIVDSSTLAALKERRLLLLDLAVPRNVEPNLAAVRGVSMIDLDHLLMTQIGRQVGIATAEVILDEELARFRQWRRERNVARSIVALLQNQRANECSPKEQARRLHRQIMHLKAGVAA